MVTRLGGIGELSFIGATVSVNASNFVFHLVLSRLLGPSSYGALGALLNVTAVVTVPLAAVQVTVAQSTIRRFAGGSPPLRRMMQRSAVAALVALALWSAATPVIDRFFHLKSAVATLALGIWLVTSVMGAGLEGVLIGQRRFRVVALGQLAGAAAARMAVGVVLVEVGLGVTGGILGTVAASAVVLLIYGAALRSSIFAGGAFEIRKSDAALSSLALAGTALLTSIDAWLARHFLEAHAAGLFTAAATAGRVALFLPATMTVVFFPRMAADGGNGAESRKALRDALVLVSLFGLGVAGVIAVLPGLTVGVLFGPAFAHARAAVGIVAIADAGLGISSCLVYFLVARRSNAALAPWVSCLVAVALAVAFHGSITVLALDMLAATWLLVLVAAFAAAREIFARRVPHRGFLHRVLLLRTTESDLNAVTKQNRRGIASRAAVDVVPSEAHTSGKARWRLLGHPIVCAITIASFCLWVLSLVSQSGLLAYLLPQIVAVDRGGLYLFMVNHGDTFAVVALCSAVLAVVLREPIRSPRRRRPASYLLPTLVLVYGTAFMHIAVPPQTTESLLDGAIAVDRAGYTQAALNTFDYAIRGAYTDTNASAYYYASRWALDLGEHETAAKLSTRLAKSGACLGELTNLAIGLQDYIAATHHPLAPATEQDILRCAAKGSQYGDVSTLIRWQQTNDGAAATAALRRSLARLEATSSTAVSFPAQQLQAAIQFLQAQDARS